ncbi:DUF5914 domain-containing protein [Streptomyces sp. ID05-04B]|uniref:DUF5914 domain-containing protein n=1 Tax=unclassified Streptomyces TaxID=2593676 RepID=UPI000D1A3E57|nr:MULTISPECIES: DUF5914 domain-containing protein [unclassified Streptomyces]AVV47067.1 2Fe-2S ferredoxin [Streptomyces sp. P3]MDX5570454.1 DUF5914 domain-containing protein [Streptomyces sp. ID05-04B]
MSPDRSPRRGRLPLSLRRHPVAWERQRPTWREARPAVIARALKHAQARPSGNWYVVGASRDVRDDRPLARTVAGQEIVVWRDASGRLVAGPGICPHLGAPLRDSPVRCGTLVCHWHGLALRGGPFAGWDPVPAHDDGVLVWVRLDDVGGEPPLEAPVVPVRPALARAVSAVYVGIGTCEPEDVVANRLDPWHGAWFHPYSFVDLTVVEVPGAKARGTGEAPGTATAHDAEGEDGFTVDVSFKLAGRLVVPVRAVFTAPEPRTVVMRITGGEGRGSVVETHATPLGHDDRGRPRTAVVEAVVAASDRPGFGVARTLSPLLRPLVRAAAGRLWRDDLAYARRRWHLRSTGRFPG